MLKDENDPVKRKGCLWWFLKMLIGAFSILVLLMLVGYVYNYSEEKDDSKNYPPLGKLFDIGEYKLHLYTTGSDTRNMPTVILCSAGGLAAADWALVQPEISELTRVCSYDRAGYGWSDSGSLPRTSKQIAVELHALLEQANIDGPYLLVGHSFGGHTVRIFADDYPEEVAGLILIDARPANMLEIPSLKIIGDGSGSEKFSILSFLANIGVTRLLGNAMLPPKFQDRLPDYPAVISYRAKYFKANKDEALSIRKSDQQVKNTKLLGNLPLTVIRHGIPDIFENVPTVEPEIAESDWIKSQEELSSLSTNSRIIVANKSGHFIPIELPEFVIESIKIALS